MTETGPSKFARIRLAIRGEGAEAAQPDAPAAASSGSSPDPAPGTGQAAPEAQSQKPPEAQPLSSMDRRVKLRRITPKRVAAAAALAVLLLAGGIFYARYGLTSALSVDGERLSVAPVRLAVFQEYIPVTGNIVPAHTVYLDAVEGGQVTDVIAEEGQMVEAGDPLLELRNPDLQLRLVEAEARLTEQINNLNTRRLSAEQEHLRFQERLISLDEQIITLERDLARNERLLAADAVAAKTVEDMRDQLEGLRNVRATVLEAQRINREMQTNQTAQMQVSVDAISANLEVARENLDNLVMRAPIQGQLTIFDANLGEAKMRGQRIGQIDDIGAFKVSAMVDEFYLGRVLPGQSASVRIGGRDVALEVDKVYPNVRERQFQIDLEFAGEAPPGLRRGQTLRMNLEIGAQSESLTAANGPWVDDTGGVWAFVLTQDGATAYRRAVGIGRRNPDMVEVLSGLEAGERLIVSSYAQLGDFDRIDIRGSTIGAAAR